MDFTSVRNEFPVLETWTYMNAASRGPLRTEVVGALTDYYSTHLHSGDSPLLAKQRREMVAKVRGQFAELIGAHSTEIAYTKNTTDGLNAIAHGLRIGAGDNVVVVPALEHPTGLYCISHLRHDGVDVRNAENQGDAYHTEAIVSIIDARTRLVFVSVVSFLSGARADLRRISARCREVGAVLLVDAAQALGTVRIDVESEGIDALATSTQKGLLGIHGLGLLYCRRELAQRITPIYLGRTSVQLPDQRQYIIGDIEHYELASSAARFEVGHSNYPAIFALERCLDFLLGLGTSAIEDQVMAITASLMTGLGGLGVDIATPEQRPQRGNIVAVRCGDSQRVADQLQAANIAVAHRRDVVRFGLHLYNNAADIQRVLDVLSDLPSGVLSRG